MENRNYNPLEDHNIAYDVESRRKWIAIQSRIVTDALENPEHDGQVLRDTATLAAAVCSCRVVPGELNDAVIGVLEPLYGNQFTDRGTSWDDSQKKALEVLKGYSVSEVHIENIDTDSHNVAYDVENRRKWIAIQSRIVADALENPERDGQVLRDAATLAAAVCARRSVPGELNDAVIGVLEPLFGNQFTDRGTFWDDNQKKALEVLGDYSTRYDEEHQKGVTR